MHSQHNARPFGLTDDEIEMLALKHIAPGYDRLRAIIGECAPYQHSDQFLRIKALLTEATSKMRADGASVAVTDHRGDVHWKNGRKPGITLYDAPVASAPADDRAAFEKCHSAIIKALSSIARADGPDTRKADDPELLYRSPVMDDVVRIRVALDECSAALASAPVADERDFEDEAHDRDNYLATQATTSVAALANDPFLAARAWRKPVAGDPAAGEAISDLAALQWAEKYGIQWALHTPDAIREVIADAQRLAVAQTHGERLARYCPGCGSVGPVEGDYHDCCPDGDEARMVPAALAEKCRETFNIAVKALMANAAANDASAQGAGERESWKADMLAAGATHLGGDCWEWEADDFEFKIWQMGVHRAMARHAAPAGEPESGDA